MWARCLVGRGAETRAPKKRPAKGPRGRGRDPPPHRLQKVNKANLEFLYCHCSTTFAVWKIGASDFLHIAQDEMCGPFIAIFTIKLRAHVFIFEQLCVKPKNLVVSPTLSKKIYLAKIFLFNPKWSKTHSDSFKDLWHGRQAQTWPDTVLHDRIQSCQRCEPTAKWLLCATPWN